MNTKILIRRAALAGWDVVAWLTAVGVLVLVRYDFNIASRRWDSIAGYMLAVVVVQLALGFLLHLYLGRDDGGPTRDNFWLTSILVDPDVAGFTAEDVRAALAEADIEARPLWKPMHLQPVFAGARAYVNGTSERLFRTGLSLPSGSVLGEAEIDRIDAAIWAVVGGRVPHA